MKKIILVAAILAISVNALAVNETKTQLDSVNLAEQDSLMLATGFHKNWEFGLMVGAQAYLAEYQRFSSTSDFNPKDWWMPGLDLYIQKWASPVFGIGLGFNVAGYTGIYTNGDAPTATFMKGSDAVYKSMNPKSATEFHRAYGAYANLFAKANFDLTNLFCGYNPKRVFSWTGYLGGGVIIPVSQVNKYYPVGASFNAGLNFMFKLSRAWQLGFAVRGALISDTFNGIGYTSSLDIHNIPLDGMIGLTVGASYKFGFVERRNTKTGKVASYEWVPVTTAAATSVAVAKEMAAEVDKVLADKDAALDAANTKIKESNEKLTYLEAENSKLASELSAVSVSKKYWAHVNFPINRWEIRKEEKVNILAAADYIKSCPETKFIVRGYADKQTATSAHNEKLSVNRANAVKDVLVNEFGINPDQLVIEHYGGVDYMFFEDAQCSRSVIITNIE